jgi:DNA-binding LacI/PurR family transcriptional regulator
VPFVVANLEQVDMPYTATRVDHADASRRAVELLAQMGHRRIAYIGAERSVLFYAESLRGYIEGLAQAGIDIDSQLVFEFTTHGMPRSLCGYTGAMKLLAMDNRPTAIVAARDMYAEGAWYAIEHTDLEVGTDVSLVGYDDLSWSYGWDMALTTFRQPCFAMGAKAVEMLIARIAGGGSSREQVVLDSPLVMRRSVGPVPRRIRKASFNMPFDDIGVVNRGL